MQDVTAFFFKQSTHLVDPSCATTLFEMNEPESVLLIIDIEALLINPTKLIKKILLLFPWVSYEKSLELIIIITILIILVRRLALVFVGRFHNIFLEQEEICVGEKQKYPQ